MRRPTLEHPATVLAAHPIAPPRKPSLLSTAGFLAITLVVGLLVVTRGGGLEPAAAQAPAPTHAPGRILVTFRPDTDHATKIALRSAVQGNLVSIIDDIDARVWKVPAG